MVCLLLCTFLTPAQERAHDDDRPFRCSLWMDIGEHAMMIEGPDHSCALHYNHTTCFRLILMDEVGLLNVRDLMF